MREGGSKEGREEREGNCMYELFAPTLVSGRTLEVELNELTQGLTVSG